MKALDATLAKADTFRQLGDRPDVVSAAVRTVIESIRDARGAGGVR